MDIIFHKETKTFHLYNEYVSYIFKILDNGQLGQLYYGKKILDRESFDHLLVLRACCLAPAAFRGNLDFTLETIKQEYPAYGTGDYRMPAYQLEVSDGSRITNFVYKSHKIYNGKKKIDGLPCTYGKEEEVKTVEIILMDSNINCEIVLYYSIFKKYGVITRSAAFKNNGEATQKINSAMSMSVDFPDYDFEILQLDGAWSRERHITNRQLNKGITSIGSIRGASSSNHNPFMCLKRKNTNENSGEAYGFALIYSGNFIAQAEVDAYNTTRILMGINPMEFAYTLMKGESFNTPEAVMVYSNSGLNTMSQSFHELFKNNLMRGFWKDKTRPILINNWEATYFDFNEEKILDIAKKAKSMGIELFVLDDGWFGKRNNDSSSLGDWQVNLEKIPNGIEGLSKKIHEMGLMFGLWFEPEMVNEVSNLYNTHPEWIIGVPNRNHSYGRNQFVLDFSRKDVVDYIFNIMKATLDKCEINYIKWDMNRNITEAYSLELSVNRQGEFFHRYILGVYDLYERLIKQYPNILFESCASGGGRFDPGMLYYAPQAWTSDDTDAIERLNIQKGTSMLYPLVSMGSHVAAVPNHQVNRKTSLKTRGDVAYFGTFGYELDITKISLDEEKEMLSQIEFFKENRDIIQFGDFYRLDIEDENYYGWMVVSKDKKKALFAYYKVLAKPNPGLKRFKLEGLLENYQYYCNETKMFYFGDELMNVGINGITEFTGVTQGPDFDGSCISGDDKGDFTSHIFTFEVKHTK